MKPQCRFDLRICGALEPVLARGLLSGGVRHGSIVRHVALFATKTLQNSGVYGLQRHSRATPASLTPRAPANPSPPELAQQAARSGAASGHGLMPDGLLGTRAQWEDEHNPPMPEGV